MSDLEPSGVHASSCAIWLSADPCDSCDCGDEETFPLLVAEPGTTAHHLHQLDREVAS